MGCPEGRSNEQFWWAGQACRAYEACKLRQVQAPTWMRPQKFPVSEFSIACQYTHAFAWSTLRSWSARAGPPVSAAHAPRRRQPPPAAPCHARQGSAARRAPSSGDRVPPPRLLAQHQQRIAPALRRGGRACRMTADSATAPRMSSSGAVPQPNSLAHSRLPAGRTASRSSARADAR
jgi:hypothetical protein